MSTYKNPNVPLITNPYNVDNEIQVLQVALSDLAWLDKSYGKAETGRTEEGGKEIIYPEVYTSETKKQYQSCLPNNKLKSQSFFKVNEPVSINDAESFSDLNFTLNLSCIFWFNLEIIARDSPYDTLDYRFTEVLLAEVLDVLKMSGAIIENIYYSPSKVYEGYTLNHLEQQELKHPYSGFRIDLSTSFIQKCI